MFKKSDTLPLVLALISTLVVLGLGYGVLATVKSSNTAENNNSDENNALFGVESNSNEAIPAVSFSDPGIVPMGISVKINGSDQMSKVNKLLKRSFQQEFPGTTVNFDADGNDTGIRLLLSGQVDLAAIARPLQEDELSRGLTAVTVEGKYLEEADNSDPETLFYAYRKPANIKVEAFLGHLFSTQGQEAIIDR